MGHIYTNTKPDGITATIQAYSDEELQGAVEQLSSADYLGTWGKTRLEKLMAEARRRKLNRKESK